MPAQRIVEMTLFGEAMAVQDSALDRFTEFVTKHEARLREALMAACGGDAGRDAAAEALMYSWDNLDRLGTMEEPLGYLYRVSLTSARDGRTNSRVAFDPVETTLIPDVDPYLPNSLSRLPEQERVPLVLVDGFQWTEADVGALLGLEPATVLGYANRGTERLRNELGDASSSNVQRQLADYGFRQRQLHGALSAGEVLERFHRAGVQAAVGPAQEITQVRSHTRSLRSLRIAVAGTVLVLFGGAAFALRTTASDAPDSHFDQLRRVEHNEVAFDQSFDLEMSSVTVGGPGFVAVGSHGSRSQPYVATVWTSVDSVSWFRVPNDESVLGTGDAFSDGLSMRSVTAGGPGLVAVGSDEPDAAVWTSVDGITWTRGHVPIVQLGWAEMSAVTTGGPGLIAVGHKAEQSGSTEAAVWTSPDGIIWSRVLADGVFDDAEMSSVTQGGPGLVAVGADLDGSAAVWVSDSGTDWTRVPHDASVFGDSAMSSVTDWGSGLVAVGYRRGGEWYDGEWLNSVEAAVWTTPDGVTWSRVDMVAAFDGSEISSVANTGSGLVGVGSVAAALGRYAATWTSTDGITWALERDSSSSPARILGITAATVSRHTPGSPGGARVRGFVAVGSAGSDAGVWVIHPLWEECRRRLGESVRERIGCDP